jgi:hypothetical protein
MEYQELKYNNLKNHGSLFLINYHQVLGYTRYIKWWKENLIPCSLNAVNLTQWPVDWDEGDMCSSKRMGEADCTVISRHAHSLQPVMICQSNGIKMGGHKMWKSQTWRLCCISFSVSEPIIIGWCSSCRYSQLYQLTVCCILDCALNICINKWTVRPVCCDNCTVS